MPKKSKQTQANEIEKEETNKLLKGILLALALKAEKREDKAKILKMGGLNQTEILELIGISETTKRTRKHRVKQQQKKQKGFLPRFVSGEKNEK